MTKFRVVYYPQRGERHSPYDILKSLNRKRRTSIRKRLDACEDLEYEQWPRHWSKQHSGDIKQFSSGSYRVMYVLDNLQGEDLMIVLHIFRKSANKTTPKQQNRVEANYEDYLRAKEELS